MSPEISWGEVALRLVCTVVAGALIGINRGEHGRAAGLRTTLLVCLAASLAMIQANLLLDTTGKSANSFVVLDLMRLPLGILSGMGFIGAGAILRRGNAVLGVTTAATLWFVTVMGLLFGGGQILLGFIALILGWLTLSGLKWVEEHWQQDCNAMLKVIAGPNGPNEDELVQSFSEAGYKINFLSVTYNESAAREMNCEIFWRGKIGEKKIPPNLLRNISTRFVSAKFIWQATNTFRADAVCNRANE